MGAAASVDAAMGRALRSDAAEVADPRLRPLLIDYAMKRKLGVPAAPLLNVMRLQAKNNGIDDLIAPFELWLKRQCAHPDDAGADGEEKECSADHRAPGVAEALGVSEACGRACFSTFFRLRTPHFWPRGAETFTPSPRGTGRGTPPEPPPKSAPPRPLLRVADFPSAP